MAGSSDEAKKERFDIAVAVLLGVAATLTAFAGYRSAIFGGDAVKDYSKAIRTVNESSQAYTEGNQEYALDQALFIEYIKAAQADNHELIAYLRESLMSERLQKAIKWWEQQPDETGPDTPFVDENPEYNVEQWAAGEELLNETDRLFTSGERNDDRGDNFDLVVAILATSLFMYGIGAVTKKFKVQLVTVAAGFVIMVLGIVKMLTI
jgi:hypothetical protein